jgi:proteasome lid subunit RPN8/RPN11
MIDHNKQDELEIVLQCASGKKLGVTHPKIDLSNQSGYQLVGRPSKGDLRIIIEDHIYQFLHKYSAADTTRELGAILVGTISGESSPIVHVQAAIEAKYTESESASVKFTQKTWEYVNSIKDSQYPDKRIVGWFHTHPGFGIFLSSYDTFIHRNFFDLPWQIAYVIDPLAKKEGILQWKDTEIVRCGGFYRHGGEIPAVSAKTAFGQNSKIKRMKRRLPIGVRDAVMAVEALAIIYLILKPLGTGRVEQYKPPAVVPPVHNAVQSAKTDADPQTEFPKIIMVAEGESLWSISKREYGAGRFQNIISAHNRIKNSNQIHAGDILELPDIPDDLRRSGAPQNR